MSNKTHRAPLLLAMILAPALATAAQDRSDAPPSIDPATQQVIPSPPMDPAHAKPEAPRAMTDQQFLDKAHASGVKEVHSARLAQHRSENPDVDELAAMIERDHENLNSELVQAGAQASARNPDDVAVGDSVARNAEGPTDTHPSAPPEQMSEEYTIKKLQGDPMMQPLIDAKGTGFDRAYIRMQVAMHEKSIAMFEAMANGAENSTRVKGLANDALPTLRKHLERAREISAGMGPDMFPAKQQ